MSAEAALQSALQIVEPWAQEVQSPEPERRDVVVSASDLPAIVQALQQAHWGYLSGITGIDQGVEAGTIEVLYHFFSGPAALTLRVRTPRTNPVVPSICPVVPSATFFERELMEMLGVTVTDTPNTDRLFLPDSWPKGQFPLRKDWQGKEVTV